MNLTTNNISFLKDIHPSINVDKRSRWRQHYFDGLDIVQISSFIKFIGDDKIYLLIPLFMDSKSLSKPTLNLSEPFLVNNKSNSVLITRFILDQYYSSGFKLKEDIPFIFSIKFKRVWIIEE
nr:hypothetical protein [Russula sp.]